MRFFPALIVALSLPLMAQAQGAQIAFGKSHQNVQAPVEITSDALSVNQNTGSAIFTGHVIAAQGDMRLSAPRVQVEYAPDSKRIRKLFASGGVTLVSGTDAAEGQTADYDIDTGKINMHGNVLLVQPDSTMTSENMAVDLQAGTAQMEGRVKTVLKTK